MFHIANSDDIKKGRLTDVYFKRTEEILKSAGKNPVVKAEIFLKGFPDNADSHGRLEVSQTIQQIHGIRLLAIHILLVTHLSIDVQPAEAQP